MLREHSPLQWAQFALWLFAFLLGCALVRSLYASRNRSRLWLALPLTAFCLFVGMEEINWGYHFLDRPLPQYFKDNSSQQAFSLHNLHVFQPVRNAALSILSLVMVLWAYCSVTGRYVCGRITRPFRFDAVVAFLAVVSLIVSLPAPTSITGEWRLLVHPELGELVIASVFFCWMHGMVRQRPDGP